ncbi:MAG TPA: DUF4350 domain-containing protein [Alphaproteobacteria bacterium]|nr:DUF4350 domain-containing protein [Alphaproteobacteria bacterium]
MKKYFPIVILLGCTATFVLGVVYLFDLRFESGDVYPPYSSLRADPLGTMAFYESLKKIPALAVRRDFSASDELPEEPQTVYLHLSGDTFELEFMPDEEYRSIQNFLTRGGRLVITLFPKTEQQRWFYEDATNSAETKQMTNSVENKQMTNSANKEVVKFPTNKKVTKSPSNKKVRHHEDYDYSWVSLEDKWNFHIGFQKLEPDGDTYAPAAVSNQTTLALPATLYWHSGTMFTNVSNSWRVIYARSGSAVMMERNFGRGSVVIASDSYLFSNEAMLKDRHADLLAWLVGPAKNVVFDEAHFGIVENPGVAELVRKYHLQGLAAGLLALAGLFIWKHSSSLVPALADERAERFVAGKDSAAGFVNLLRRCIPPRDLMATCFDEWKKSVTQGGKQLTGKYQQAEADFAAGNTGPNRSAVETYRKITDTLGTQNQKL